MIRSFLDSGVLISSSRINDDLGRAALAVLDDANRVFLSSPFVQLEVLPKAIYGRRFAEVVFYRAFFDNASTLVDRSSIIDDALDLAGQYGLNGMDALHLAAARAMNADEFVTTERPTSPIFRVTDILIVTIRPTPSHNNCPSANS